MAAVHSIKTYYINLSPDQKIPIVFGECAHASIQKNELGHATRALIVTNQTVARLCDWGIAEISTHLGLDTRVLALSDGESEKTLDGVSAIIDACVDHRMSRHDVIVAVGGGVVGDMAGFAASIYLRGIGLIQVPTSLLAQVDAAIGGKTGVNHTQGKNLIGTFYQPLKIIVDPRYLTTLSSALMKEGMAEIAKYALIMDKPLFWYIEQHMGAIQPYAYTKSTDVWHYLIQKSIQNKAQVVSQDEKEAEFREILNFGHTIGHALESALGYDGISHGEAVANGMVVEAMLGVAQGHLSEPTGQKIKTFLTELGFNLSFPAVPRQAFLNALQCDKKIKKDKIRFIIPTDIGQTKPLNDCSQGDLMAVLTPWVKAWL